MSPGKVRRSLLTSLVLAGTGLVGCSQPNPEASNAGIPSHRGPASPSTKKLKPARSLPKIKSRTG